MTQNAWNTSTLESAGDGKILIGSGSGRPTAANITAGTSVSITNGTNSITVGKSSGGSGNWILISTATASASSSINFTGLSSTYFMYVIRFSNLAPATDQTTLWLRTSTNNGSSYDAGASDYNWNTLHLDSSGTQTSSLDTADSSIELMGPTGGSNEMGNGSNESGSGFIYIFNPSHSKVTYVYMDGFYFNESGSNNAEWTAGYRDSTTAVNAVRIMMDSGNIATGDFVLYGVTAS